MRVLQETEIASGTAQQITDASRDYASGARIIRKRGNVTVDGELSFVYGSLDFMELRNRTEGRQQCRTTSLSRMTN